MPHCFNVCTGYLHRMQTSEKFWGRGDLSRSEGWGLAVNRGYGNTRAELIHSAGGAHCTAGELHDGGWRIVQLGKALRNPHTTNDIEKRVHKMLSSDARKLWRVDGAGAVSVSKDPSRNVYAIVVVFGPCGDGTPFVAGPPTKV